jgi:60 kDa SS-A/Ro ribonucleoprotein
MTSNIYSKHTATRNTVTPQKQPIPGSHQTSNNAGGFGWTVDDWTRLDRFLILGSEGGTYYTTEKELTVDNAQAVVRCIQADGLRVVKRVVEISDQGRAAKNDPALFVLAICATATDVKTRQAALSNLAKVARTGTHLFTFLEMVEGFRGWGPALVKAVSAWYNDKTVDSVAYQAVKYRQRNGWTHRDALRLSHPKADQEVRNALYGWIVKDADTENVRKVRIVDGFLKIQQAKTAKEAAELITEYKLPRETVPTQFLKDKAVWEALLVDMPLTALIRNLGNMGTYSVLVPGNYANINSVVEKLSNADTLHKSRVHPIGILAALATYQQGHGTLGSNSWQTVPQVIDALDKAFYLAFDNVVPTGKRFMLGIDVSGSMSGGAVSGVAGLTPAMAAAAMLMVTARTEKNYTVQAYSDRLVQLGITANMSLSEVMNRTKMSYGGTDCSQPILYALDNRIEVDVFVNYTDSESWTGYRGHPTEVLKRYRKEMGIPAKLACVSMVSNYTIIADPDDPYTMDVVGFDTATPQGLSEFAKM